MIFDGATLGPNPPPSLERAWTAYLLEAQDSLRMLAERTGGQFVSAVWDIDTVMKEIGIARITLTPRASVASDDTQNENFPSRQE